MKLEILLNGRGYLESPRWHNGALWVSDFDSRQVLEVSEGGQERCAISIAGVPSGLAFIGGDVLVASMRDQTVQRISPAGSVSEYADLSEVAVGHLNDMVTDRSGGLYVGCFGYDLAAREQPRPGPLLYVDAEGGVSVACPDLMFANGMVITPDEQILVVAESAGRRLTRFRIINDGLLIDRQVVAELGSRQPDGICMDAEAGIWLASPFTEEFLRLAPNGSITHVVPTPGRWAVACALGGVGGDTFFAITAETDLKRFANGESHGRVEVGTAPVPAATV